MKQKKLNKVIKAFTQWRDTPKKIKKLEKYLFPKD